MDILSIKGLRVDTHIGVYQWEQMIKQRLLIDIEINTDVSRCDDNIDNALDYAHICKLVTEHVSQKNFKLIETVAEEVASVLKESLLIKAIKVTIHKPHAISQAQDLSITIHR